MRIPLLVFLVSCCATFYACGPGANAVPAVASSAMSASDARSFQMSDTAPCLSLEKVFAVLSRARQSRDTVTDIRIAEDGSAVSPAFVNSVISNTVMSVSPMDTQGGNQGFRQNGCESISMLDSDGHETRRLKLLQATATRLVTEKYSFQPSPEQSIGSVQLTIELLSTRQATWRTLMPYTTSHDKTACGIQQEDHEVSVTSFVEFGDALGAAPAVSGNVVQLEARSHAYQDPANEAGNKKDEQAYCAQLLRQR